MHTEETRFEETAGGPGPRATRLLDDGKLYALGATGRLNCLDAQTGEPFWSVDISGGEEATPEWGFASSPLIWAHPALAGGRLFVRNGDEAVSFDLRRE